jgi:hypothetical protein
MPLLIPDVSILSISATVLLMLLHFIATAAKGRESTCEPSAGLTSAAVLPLP